MIEEFSKFPATELQIGAILPTGVVLDIWEDEEADLGRLIIAMTASGVGHAFPRDSMVENVLGRVSDEMVEQLRAEFAEAYIELYGDPTADKPVA
jgi:hypothetical protein